MRSFPVPSNTVLRSVLVPPFPVNTPPISKTGKQGDSTLDSQGPKDDPRLSFPHVKFHQSVEQAVNSSAQVSGTVPASSAAIGEAGTFAADANFLYYCYAKNSWRKIPGVAF